MNTSDTSSTRHPGRRHAPISRRKLFALCAPTLLPSAEEAVAKEVLKWDEVKARIRARYPTVAHISVPALQAWLQDDSRTRPLLFDTRTPAEFAVSHLQGAHQAQVLDDVLRVLSAQPQARHVVLYCSVGKRSSALAERLSQHFSERKATRLQQPHSAAGSVPEVLNLEGSLFEWANAGLPMRDARGAATQVHPFDGHWGTLLQRRLWHSTR